MTLRSRYFQWCADKPTRENERRRKRKERGGGGRERERKKERKEERKEGRKERKKEKEGRKEERKKERERKKEGRKRKKRVSGLARGRLTYVSRSCLSPSFDCIVLCWLSLCGGMMANSSFRCTTCWFGYFIWHRFSFLVVPEKPWGWDSLAYLVSHIPPEPVTLAVRMERTDCPCLIVRPTLKRRWEVRESIGLIQTSRRGQWCAEVNTTGAGAWLLGSDPCWPAMWTWASYLISVL